MHVSIQKWGNSLALRIPHLLAKEAHLRLGEKAEIRLSQGRLVLIPATRKQWTLKALLAGIKKTNLHPEIQTQGPVGREAW